MTGVDFELSGFDLARRNHILVRAAERPAYADASLPIRAICECFAGPVVITLPRAGMANLPSVRQVTELIAPACRS